MKPLPFFGVAAQQVTAHPAHVLKIEGQFLGATADRYLQVHDSEVVAAEGAVPLKSWLIAQSSPFFQSFAAGELAVALGLYICVSSTDATKTLSADTMDLGVELTDPELPTGTTIYGDLTSGGVQFQVWDDGAGPHRLIRLEVDGTGLSANSWILITNQNYLINPATKILESYPLPIGKKYIGLTALSFGRHGREIVSISSDGVIRNGFFVWISTQQYVVHPTGGNFATCRAEYK